MLPIIGQILGIRYCRREWIVENRENEGSDSHAT
jgi:hypothetical protein